MSIWKRSMIFLSRKKFRSLLLLSILFIFGFVMSLSISTYNTSKKAATQLKEELGGSFVVTQNRIEDASLWGLKQYESGSVRIYYGPKVNSSVIKSIAGVEGIKEYNEEDVLYMHLTNSYILPGLYQGMLDLAKSDPRFEPYPNDLFWRNVTNFVSNDYSKLNSYFRSNSLELIEGRHINKNDREKILVSQVFAENNHVGIGDTIQVEMTQQIASAIEGEDTVLYEFQPEIVGIYKTNLQQAVNEYTPESNIIDNYVFLDTFTMQRVNKTFESDMGPSRKATFFVQDASRLDSVIKEVMKIKSINWTYYNLEKDDTMYRSSVKPLDNLSMISILMSTGIWLASLLVVGLLLTMWTQERKREIGILISMGITKREIIMQLLLECTIVAVTAFALSFVVTNYAAESLANCVLQVMKPEEKALVELTEDEIRQQIRVGDYNDEQFISIPSNTPDYLDVNSGIGEILFVFFTGMFVIIIAVWRGSKQILRRKPREILSAR